MRRALLSACLLASLAGCAAPAPPGPSPAWAASPTPAPSEEPPMPGEELLGPLLVDEDFERGLSAWSGAVEGPALGFRLFGSPMCGGAFVVLFGREDGGPFREAAEGTLTRTEPLDLRGATAPWLKYDVRGTATPPEAIALVAEVRHAGGEWTPVGRPALGRYPIVRTFAADLTPYKAAPVYLRFRVSRAAVEVASPGLLLDDVRVIEPRGQVTHPL